VRLRVVRRALAAQGASLGGDLHPVLGRVYAARGVHSAADLDNSLGRLLPVGTLEGIPAAVELLLQHRTAGRVLIIGDFDADGATSSALMVRALRSFGFAAVDFLVPNRFQFGYGLTPGSCRWPRRARRRSSSRSTTASRATPVSPPRARSGSRC